MSSSADRSAEQLAAVVDQLRVANAGLREVIDAQAAQLEAQAGRIAELERRLGADSTTSNRPPSADSPYRKQAPRSSRRASGRTPGKQPGQPGTTMALIDAPDEVVVLDPGSCTGCGSDLGDAPVSGVQRRQVTDVVPPPLPRVTEYQLITRICRGCAATTCAPAPAVAPARAQYGASVLARAAELTCAHYLPIARATALIGSLLGVPVSTGFTSGVRARAARLLEMTFLPRVRELLTQVGVLHADETPGRAEGGLSYVHVACTEYLTAMHTGGRAKTDIDAGGVLPGYAGTIVRDGYAGYAHLIDAAHAWCGAHLLRELRATHAADPDRQFWAAAMADTLTDAHHRAEGARAEGHDRIDDTTLAGIVNRYRGATAAGISDNTNRVGPADRDALRLARRFRQHEAMILRFVVDLAVPWTNNQAERDIRPVKIQQRTSGGCWRTLAGLADFAVVRSYLSTATKWGIETLDAFERLFTTGAWLPPAATPC